jgi:tetratricopeptide (TPR) repeat protein
MRRYILLLGLAVVAVSAGYVTWTRLQQEREDIWQSGLGKALSAHAARRDNEAANTLETLLPEAEKWWPQGQHVITTLSWLGTIYRVENKYTLAEPTLKRAIDLAEQTGSPATIEVGRAKLNLAIIARDESDDVAAERLFSEAAEILSKNPRKAWGDDAAAFLNLGFLAMKEGRYQDAESPLKRAVAGYEAIAYGTLDPDRANAHFHLAEVYRHLDDNAQAATHFETALKIYEQIEGPHGKDVENTLSGLALVQEGPGAVGRAQSLIERSVDGSKNLAEMDGASLINLAGIAVGKQQYLEAESLYQKACAAYEKSGGPDDIGLSHALVGLGDLYRDHEQFDLRKAQPPLERALAIREANLGPDHPDTARVLSDLSLLNFYERNFSAALSFGRRALPGQEKAFGAESLEVSTTLNRIGIAERDLGMLEAAEADLQHALAIRETKKAPDRWIAISLENLASVYELEGKDSKAASLVARARTRYSSTSDNP